MSIRRKAFGLHVAESILEGLPEQVVQVWVDISRRDPKLLEMVRRFELIGRHPQTAVRSRLDALAEGGNHQGIVVEYLAQPEMDEGGLREAIDRLDRPAFFLVLDHVQDPHNLGACLRSANAAGVHGVISTRDQSVGITPVVAKVACGAAESTPYYRVTNLVRTLQFLKDRGIWIVGAAGEADLFYDQVDLRGGLAIVMGAEGRGLRRLTRENCDYLVKIPMQGQVESLNVSVAAGVLLFEALRQRSVS